MARRSEIGDEDDLMVTVAPNDYRDRGNAGASSKT
jgi:hypothetical protein